MAPSAYTHVGFPMPGECNGRLGMIVVATLTVDRLLRTGSDYWTAETIAAVGERYDGVDMTPYTQARL